jgi:DNA invertase Pin-like site-specific DNA recombinase
MRSDPERDTEKGTELVRAAGYVRASAEHDQHSQENQKSSIRHYAVTHDLNITVIFSDQGEVEPRNHP